jgi:hypothetical protein
LLSAVRLALLASARVDRGDVFFFRAAAGIEARRLVDYSPFLAGEWLHDEEGAFIPPWAKSVRSFGNARPKLRSG